MIASGNGSGSVESCQVAKSGPAAVRCTIISHIAGSGPTAIGSTIAVYISAFIWARPVSRTARFPLAVAATPTGSASAETGHETGIGFIYA